MNSTNPRSSDFSYKKYSLEQLDNWVNDALNCEDLTPQDIYDTIVNVVDESVEYHKKYLTKSIELLSLLKGHRPVEFDYTEIDEPWDYTATGEKFPRVSNTDWENFWAAEDNSQYTEEEMDAMCERAATENDKEQCREYNLREAEYYNKRAQLDADYEAIKAAGGYDWTPLPTEDKVKKWRLPVQQSSVDGVDDYYIEFPDDLLEAANLKEGDSIEWVDQGDGSYILKKVPVKAMTYDESIAAGWTMTADGFWIKG